MVWTISQCIDLTKVGWNCAFLGLKGGKRREKYHRISAFCKVFLTDRASTESNLLVFSLNTRNSRVCRGNGGTGQKTPGCYAKSRDSVVFFTTLAPLHPFIHNTIQQFSEINTLCSYLFELLCIIINFVVVNLAMWCHFRSRRWENKCSSRNLSSR